MKPQATNLTLGEILVHMCLVTEAQMTAALEKQQATKVRIGEVLVAMGYVDQVEIDEAVKIQEQLRNAESSPRALGEMAKRAMQNFGARQSRIMAMR